MPMVNEDIVVLDAGFVGGPEITCCTARFTFITR
jgi:hypothetical protein